MSRVDWRTIKIENVHYEWVEFKNILLPMLKKKEIDVTNTFKLVLIFAPKRFFIAILKSIIYVGFGLDIFSSLIIFPSSKWTILLR